MAIKDGDDLKRMTRVIAIDSLDRGLVQEDKEAAREGDKYAGTDSDSAPESEGVDPMRIVSAGNVIVHQNEPQQAEATPPAQSSPAPSLAKLALMAALAGTGLGIAAPVTAWMLGAFDEPAVTAPVSMDDTDTYAVPLFK